MYKPMHCPVGSRYKRSFLLAAACSIAIGCDPTAKTATFTFNVQAESDPGRPLAGVLLRQGGRKLGQTDAQGTVPLSLHGSAGEQHSLTVVCPPGHASPHQPVQVVLRALADQKIPTYRTECRPLLRSLVVAVKAENGSNIPLTYQGREVARTDADGTAHALLEVPPDQAVTLVLDTSAPEHEALRPHSPELNFTMPAHDELVVFEKRFAVQMKAPTREKRQPKPRLPTRIE